MELVQDLVWTASVALILSFFVAKLVAMAMADREQESSESKVLMEDEEVRFEDKLRVQEVYQSHKRLQFAAEVEAVDRFQGKSENQEAVPVELVKKSDHGEEVSVEKAIDSDRRRGYEDEGISENRQVEESPKSSATNDVVTAHCGEAVDVKLGNDSDEDDWEGIEKSELDEGYTAAVKLAPPSQG